MPAPFGATVHLYTSIAPMPASGFAWRAGLRVPDAPSDPDELHALAEELLAPYPKAAGWSIAPTLAMTNTYAPGPEPDPIVLEWVYKDEDGQRVWVALQLLTVQHEDSLYLRPGLGPSRAVPDSLVTWWALLLALSSLARYQPVAWRRALDIDHSPIAHTLERGLEIAEQRIPELVLEAIDIPAA